MAAKGKSLTAEIGPKIKFILTNCRNDLQENQTIRQRQLCTEEWPHWVSAPYHCHLRPPVLLEETVSHGSLSIFSHAIQACRPWAKLQLSLSGWQVLNYLAVHYTDGPELCSGLTLLCFVLCPFLITLPFGLCPLLSWYNHFLLQLCKRDHEVHAPSFWQQWAVNAAATPKKHHETGFIP